MTILFAALIFGIAVFVFLLISLIRTKRSGSGRFVTVLKIIIAVEAAVFIAVFIVVIVRTLAM